MTHVSDGIREMMRECADGWADGNGYSPAHELCMVHLACVHASAEGRNVYGHTLEHAIGSMRSVAEADFSGSGALMSGFLERIDRLIAADSAS